MADRKAVANPKAVVSNLVGPEAISHNVYNHILLSPTQVSRNLSLPPNQSSGLVGGRSRTGDRVIESFSLSTSPITALTLKTKEDGLKFSTSTSTSCNVEDFSINEETSRAEEPQHHKKAFTITNSEAACLLPSNGEDKNHPDAKEVDKIPPEECDYASQDDISFQDDNQIHTVEDFIKLHLMHSSEKSKETIEPSTSQQGEEGDSSCSVNALQQLAQKTNEIIEHNILLQQEIASLKKETSVQTKVLTKLLRRKQKRLQSSTKTKI